MVCRNRPTQLCPPQNLGILLGPWTTFISKYHRLSYPGRFLPINLSVFVYLYILGNFIQDLDKGVFPLLVLIRIPVTAVLQFICVVMEAMAVLYGLLFPPKGFDVIKK